MANKKYLVIACSIMKEELLRFQTNGISFIFLEQSLHRTPEKMKPIIQEEMDRWPFLKRCFVDGGVKILSS